MRIASYLRPRRTWQKLGSFLSGFVTVVMLSLFASGASQALTSVNQPNGTAQESAPATLTPSRTLVVGSEQGYPPFATGMTDETAGGFTVDLWKAVAAEAGLKYTIRVRPFHQILQEFKEGKIDVLINLAISDERRQFADLTVSHVIVNGAIFVRKGESSIHSEEDFAGKSIIVLNADLGHDYAVSKGWQKQLVLVDTSAEGFQLLASGKYDAMLLSKLTGVQAVQALGLTNIEALKVKAGFSQKFAFAVHKGQFDLLAKLNEGLAVTKSEGTYNALYEKWFGIYETKEVGLRDLLKYIIPVVLVFMTILGYFFYLRQRERGASEAKLRTLYAAIEQSPASVVITDLDACIEYVNPKYTDVTGYTAEETVGQNPRILKSGQTANDVYLQLWDKVRNGQPWHGELINKRKNGEIYWEDIHIAPVMDSTGATSHYVAVKTDITERKQIEKELIQHRNHLEELVEERTSALMATEARASHLLESSADGLYGVSSDGTISFINPAACQMLGYHPDKVIGRSAHALFHHSRPDGSPFPIDECRGHDAVLRGLDMRVDNEVYWHADGHPVPVMYAVHPIIQNGENSGAVISFVDMSEQRAAAQARERALIAAENLARMRSEFLANMSHEIRTPLNGVLGFANIGRRNFLDSNKALNAFDKILSSGNLLLGVINEILDFSKIEAGKIHIDPISVSLTDAMEEMRELVDEQARSKGLQLSIEWAVDMPANCFTDGLRLRQVLLNLLSNAVKFTEHGSVTLACALHDQELVFRVTDTGIGMNADQLALLFNPFQQADGSTTRRFGGTGLGLAISKRIAELMGGSIRVDSQLGIGSRFEFRLPYLPLPESIEPSPPEQGLETLLPEHPLAGISVLVAEDDAVNQMVIKENLLEDGATVDIVGNGHDAVERVARNGPQAFDVVLMDIQMPEMDGYEATRCILELAPDLPIIGQTAHASMEERQKCLAAGMVAHIAKPIDVQALVRLIRHHVANKRASGNHLS